MKSTKRLLSFLLTFIMLLSVFTVCSPAALAAVNYNKTAALNYAAAHWAENAGDCAQFVSRCLAAGGIPASTSSSTALYNFLKGTYGVSQRLTLTGGTSGNIRQSDNTGRIAAGDPVFFYCNTCGEFTHTSLCNGTDSSGYCVDYAWNNPHDGARRITTWTHSGCGTNNWTVYSVHIGGTETPAPDLKTIGENFTELLVKDYADWGLDAAASVGAGYLFCDIDFDGVPEFITNFCDGSSQYSLNRYFDYADGKIKEIFPEGPYEEGSLQGIDWCLEDTGVCRRESKSYLTVSDSNGIYGTEKYLLTMNKSTGKFIFESFLSSESANSSKPNGKYIYFYYDAFSKSTQISEKDYNKISSDTPTAGRLFINAAEFGAKSAAKKKTDLKSSFDKAWKYAEADNALPEEVVLSKIENTNCGIKLSWNAADGASDYVIYRKAGAAASWTTLCTVSALSFTDISVLNGTNYIYTVRAKNSAGRSATYNHPGLSIISLPQPVITAKAANGSISLDWSGSGANGVNGYYLYRKAGSETSWTRIAKITNDSTVKYSDTNVKSGTTYKYTLKSYSSNGTSCAASTASLKYLAQPEVTPVNANGKITVKWSTVNGADSYLVYRKAGSETKWTKIGTVKASAGASLDDKNVKSGTTYKYTVKPASGSTYGSYCSGVAIKHLAQPAVTLANSAGKVKISWGKVAGASKYYIYRKAGSEKSWTRIAAADSTVLSYADKTVTSGTTYKYTVKALSGSYQSSYTSDAKIKYLSEGKMISATNSSTGITLKWSAVTGASGYYVYSKTASTSWVRVATVKSGSTTSVLDKTPKKGITYTYCVRPYSGSDKGTYTTTISKKH